MPRICPVPFVGNDQDRLTHVTARNLKTAQNRSLLGTGLLMEYVTSQYIFLKANNEANNYTVVRITC